MGFYIPDRDAEWESEEHSTFYNHSDIDFYEENRKKRCDVKVCQLGRDVIGSEGSQTEVILCVLCGNNGCHVKCAGLSVEEEFRCEDCGGSGELEEDQKQTITSGDDSVIEVEVENSPKKQKVDENTVFEDNIKDIQSFIRDMEPVQEVAPAPADQAALVRSRAKRPYPCPVCEGFFRSEMVLQQHMAKIHFWNKLRAMPKEVVTAGGSMFQCSEFPCQYLNTRGEVVSGHLATEHKVVFRIARSLFPSFTLPTRSPTITQENVIIIEAGSVSHPIFL